MAIITYLICINLTTSFFKVVKRGVYGKLPCELGVARIEFLIIRALVRGCCREPHPPPLPPCLPPLVPPPPLPPPPFPPFLLASVLLKSNLSGIMEKAARHIVPSSSRHAMCAGPAATARTPRSELSAEDPAPVPYLFHRSATSLSLKQLKQLCILFIVSN